MIELLALAAVGLLFLSVLGLIGAWLYFAFTAAVAGVGYLLIAGGVAITTPVTILVAIGLLLLVFFGGSLGKLMFVLLGISGAFVVWQWNLLLAILFFLPGLTIALLFTFGLLSIAAVVTGVGAVIDHTRRNRRYRR